MGTSMGSCLRVRRCNSAPSFANLSIVLPTVPPNHPRFAIKCVRPDPSLQVNLKANLSLLTTVPSTQSLCLKRSRDSESSELDTYLSTSGSTSSSSSIASAEVSFGSCARPTKLHKNDQAADGSTMTSWAKHLFGCKKPQSADATRTGSTSSSHLHPTFGTFGLNLAASNAPLLYVFDFDQTILKIHSYGSRIRAEDVTSRDLSSDVADAEFFKGFIDTMQARGAAVAVASFGEYDVIQNYLDRIAPGVFNRENICTPSCVGYKDGCSVPEGKVPMLDILVADLLCKGGGAITADIRARTVLFDDQQPNIRKASAAGYVGCFTPDAFTRRAWPEIIEYMPKSLVVQS